MRVIRGALHDKWESEINLIYLPIGVLAGRLPHNSFPSSIFVKGTLLCLLGLTEALLVWADL